MIKLLKILPITELRFVYACFRALAQISTEIRSKEKIFSLKLQFLKEISQINVVNEENLWNLNPTITQNGVLEIYYRKTTGALFPKAKLDGISRIDNSSKDFMNAVMRLELAEDMSIIKQETTLDLMGSPCLEDVRAVTYNQKILLIGTLVLTSSPNPWSSTVAVYDTSTTNMISLTSPLGRRIEKNWVPIEVKGDILRLLYSSSPMHVIEVDLLTGDQKSTIAESTGNSEKPLNGGSQFISLADGTYLRVARKRFAVLGMGRIHLNYFVHHDTNLIEIGRSRPFLFKTLGFEICNGIRLEEHGDINLTWSQNDREMFIASCNVLDVLDFIAENQNESKISLWRALLLLKKSRGI